MEQIQVEGCSDFDCGRIGKHSVLGWRMSKHTGGPAFPELGNVGCNSDWQSEPGMTLRDYFAAKAMQGEMSGPGPLQGVENIAARAYAIADAMLKAREEV